MIHTKSNFMLTPHFNFVSKIKTLLPSIKHFLKELSIVSKKSSTHAHTHTHALMFIIPNSIDIPAENKNNNKKN